MNYIIHKAADLSSQIHTCCRHANPDVPCAPECLDCMELSIKNHMSKRADAGKLLRPYWEIPYREEYDRLSAALDPAETVLTYEKLVEIYHTLLESALPPLIINGVPMYRIRKA